MLSYSSISIQAQAARSSLFHSLFLLLIKELFLKTSERVRTHNRHEAPMPKKALRINIKNVRIKAQLPRSRLRVIQLIQNLRFLDGLSSNYFYRHSE